MTHAEMEAEVAPLAERWARAAEADRTLALTPEWWQERLLRWATDPEFRVRLLRFVDVLPTLRTAAAVADHVRQYFRGPAPGPVHLASGLAAQPALRPVLSRAVRQGVFAMAGRFIAGESPAEAIPRLRSLAARGIAATVDLLGEATLSDAEADAFLRRYLELVETLAAHGADLAPHSEAWEGVPHLSVSIKLSALCAHLEPAAPDYVSAAVRARLRPLLAAAARLGVAVTVDMEQYRYKDLTHRAFADALLEPDAPALTDVGIVVQAYLRDAEEDVARLEELARRRGAPVHVRLVKGAYWDEERIVARQHGWPVPVYERKVETDASYERCTEALLDAWPRLRPAFGTHNPWSAAYAAVAARRRGLRPADVEFQSLYGMAEGLREAVAAEGYRTRVYVPVGQVIPGMAYLVRRLLENTSNESWFVRGFSLPSADGRAPAEAPAPAPEEPDAEPGGFRNTAPAPFFRPEARAAMAEALAAVRRRFGGRYPLLVGGRQVADRPAAEVRYPAEPETVVGTVAWARLEDVEEAVALARRAFPAWRDRPVTEQAAVLRRAADLVEARRFHLAALEVFESAKPWAEADADVVEAIDYLRYYAAEAERLLAARRLGPVPGEENDYVYEGRGVAAVIAPWNFPLAIITGMTAAALVTGNCAVLKPAEQSPLVAYHLAEILREAGVPPDAVHYLPGRGEEIGRALVEHPDVDLIAFTGSKAVGLSILAAAAQVRPGQRNVKRVIAEMGGKNAVIIDEDADLDQAVAGTLASAFGYAGQKCSAASRLVVLEPAYEETVTRLRHAVESLVVGPPHDPATFVPPVISGEARDRILAAIREGGRAATLLAQRPVPEGPGYYVPPTVFTDVPPDTPLAREEIFGPVLAVFRARDFREALALAMDSEYALTGGLFSRNPRHIELARREFRVGNLYVNRKITGAVVGRQPFGGLGMSGIGEKAGGPDYLRQFVQPRVVTENTVRRGFAPA
ncbi:MAG TPA: proline dehydrogenase family protein [Dehalococcoidia bacterium]